MIYVNLIVFSAVIGVAVPHTYLGDSSLCEDQGPKWKCKNLSECATARKDLYAGKAPDICWFEQLTPIVCCRLESSISKPTPTKIAPKRRTTKKKNPRPSRVTSKSISEKMCEKYSEYVYRKAYDTSMMFETNIIKVNECGRIAEPLVVGGSDAKLREFPHMVQIGYGETKIAWLCGGSLISERYVLSAAHCTSPKKFGTAKWARLGELDTDTERDRAETQIIKISERINHPQYSSDRVYHDIALYKLEKTATLNTHVRPICLQRTYKFSQDELIATGWGNLYHGGRSTNKLQKVHLNLVDNRVCNMSYRYNIGAQLPNGIVDSRMFCAGEEGKDTCQGDSGGPLQIPLKTPYCMYTQVGVTSFGRGCGQSHPGVYTRVSNYVPWIEKIVWPDQ